MSVGAVPLYRSCLLVLCLTVGHALWCGASLYAMPAGVVTSISAMPVSVVPH